MKDLTYSVPTARPVADAVAAVQQAAATHGFRVLHTHDFAATLSEKGFHHEPVTIVEICNARFAHQVLQRDVTAALMLPCPILIHADQGRTFISTMHPNAMERFYPGKGLEAIADEVERIVLAIIDEAAGKPVPVPADAPADVLAR